MSEYAIEPARLADLRSRAASRLTGSAAAKGAPTRIFDALSVLYTLASSPQTASDALALLHELQVRQVELDLQAEELRDSRVALESALRRQLELYELLPVGCFTIDRHLVVHEVNQIGAQMLGLARDEALGSGLGHFLGADGGRMLSELISSSVGGGRQASCRLKLHPKDGRERAIRVDVRAEPGAHKFFVVLTHVGGEQEFD